MNWNMNVEMLMRLGGYSIFNEGVQERSGGSSQWGEDNMWNPNGIDSCVAFRVLWNGCG